MSRRPSIPLPRDWSAHACAAFLHAVSLAHAAVTYSRGWCANSPIARVRLAGENDRHAEITCYVNWYNGWRPHQALRGATPEEVLSGKLPARDSPRVETRTRWPLARGDPALARRARGLSLVVERVEGRRHLPIVTLKRVA